MATKLILRSDVANVGKKGDIVDVSDGYARNYLVPRGFAMKATDGAVAQAAAMRKARDVKDARDRDASEQVARSLVAGVFKVAAKAGPDGRLFGSVTATDVVGAVQKQAGVELDRRRLHIDEPIKTLGTHEVPVRLHSDVEFRLTVEVVAEGK